MEKAFAAKDDLLLCTECYANDYSSKCTTCKKTVMPGLLGWWWWVITSKKKTKQLKYFPKFECFWPWKWWPWFHSRSIWLAFYCCFQASEWTSNINVKTDIKSLNCSEKLVYLHRDQNKSFEVCLLAFLWCMVNMKLQQRILVLTASSKQRNKLKLTTDTVFFNLEKSARITCFPNFKCVTTVWAVNRTSALACGLISGLNQFI